VPSLPPREGGKKMPGNQCPPSAHSTGGAGSPTSFLRATQPGARGTHWLPRSDFLSHPGHRQKLPSLVTPGHREKEPGYEGVRNSRGEYDTGGNSCRLVCANDGRSTPAGPPCPAAGTRPRGPRRHPPPPLGEEGDPAPVCPGSWEPATERQAACQRGMRPLFGQGLFEGHRPC
jgi:hypothetical protein